MTVGKLTSIIGLTETYADLEMKHSRRRKHAIIRFSSVRIASSPAAAQ
jgi:hypothetical protein